MENYLAPLYENTPEALAMSSQEWIDLQARLFQLLAKRTEHYTACDSTSIRVETAEELLRSICYTLSFPIRSSNTFGLLKSDDLEQLLAEGWLAIEQRATEGRRLFAEACESAVHIGNISYEDTLKEIGLSFDHYDIYFFAHVIPCNIDYQLCHPVSEKILGVDYICEYLQHLIFENRFCQHFDTLAIQRLLRNLCGDYMELLINIYEPVVANALGLQIIGKGIYSLDINDTGRLTLLRIFRDNTDEAAIATLRGAGCDLCCALQIVDTAEKDYLLQTVENLWPRLKAAANTGNLNGVFPPLYEPQGIVSTKTEYTDGAMMDDNDLRKLIDELSSCRYASDKVALVKASVHSLRDLIEILNVCFWDEECDALFTSLERAELHLLQDYVLNQPPDWHSETGWEVRLVYFLQ